MYFNGMIIKEDDLGKKINVLRFVDNTNNETPHILAHTGILDFMGDEIILTILPDKKIVTDEGYTEYALEGTNKGLRFSSVSILIKSHKVKISDDYTQSLEYKINDNNHVDAVKRLTACIIDVYASLIY